MPMTHPPTPINDYGRAKAAGETAVQAIDPAAAIVRTSLIYGLERMDRGTAGFVKRLKSGESLHLFADVLRQPVWVETLSLGVLKLLQTDFAGLLNIAGEQVLTREEFGRRMLAHWDIEAAGQIHSARAADISDTIPLDLRLHVEQAAAVLQMPLPGVDEVMR